MTIRNQLFGCVMLRFNGLREYSAKAFSRFPSSKQRSDCHSTAASRKVTGGIITDSHQSSSGGADQG